jgi:hypothetical protein
MSKVVPVIVVSGQGKGSGSNADYISVNLFDTPEEANEFIGRTQDLESKYWTVCEIVPHGTNIEISSPY